MDVKVNFTHQFVWASGLPDIWSTIPLGVSMKEVMNENNVVFNRLSKADALPKVSEPHLIS